MCLETLLQVSKKNKEGLRVESNLFVKKKTFQVAIIKLVYLNKNKYMI